jgi:hypothetical protein
MRGLCLTVPRARKGGKQPGPQRARMNGRRVDIGRYAARRCNCRQIWIGPGRFAPGGVLTYPGLAVKQQLPGEERRFKPVTFRYKEELDPDKIPQFGLIAEDVAKVNPDLIVRDEDGKVSTVRYEAVTAMLLNEFLKEHGKVQELEKQVAALTAGLQKVTAELETRHRASDVAISQK